MVTDWLSWICFCPDKNCSMLFLCFVFFLKVFWSNIGGHKGAAECRSDQLHHSARVWFLLWVACRQWGWRLPCPPQRRPRPERGPGLQPGLWKGLHREYVLLSLGGGDQRPAGTTRWGNNGRASDTGYWEHLSLNDSLHQRPGQK